MHLKKGKYQTLKHNWKSISWIGYKSHNFTRAIIHWFEPVSPGLSVPHLSSGNLAGMSGALGLRLTPEWEKICLTMSISASSLASGSGLTWIMVTLIILTDGANKYVYLEREEGEELRKEPLVHVLAHLVEDEPVPDGAGGHVVLDVADMLVLTQISEKINKEWHGLMPISLLTCASSSSSGSTWPGDWAAAHSGSQSCWLQPGWGYSATPRGWRTPWHYHLHHYYYLITEYGHHHWYISSLWSPCHWSCWVRGCREPLLSPGLRLGRISGTGTRQLK